MKMTIGKLLTLIKELPEDTIVMSDSGWECGPTDCVGVYYSEKANILMLTQGDERIYSYPGIRTNDWITLSNLEQE